MGQLLLLLVVALTVAAVVFGVTVLVTGGDSGLEPVEPDGGSVPLPAGRPLDESDLGNVRFDTALRGYRMAQVDEAMRRAAYDIGYKTELVGVLEAEIEALRAGRLEAADELRQARRAAVDAAGRPAASHVPVTVTDGSDTPGALDGDPSSAGSAPDATSPSPAVPVESGTGPHASEQSAAGARSERA